VGGHLRLRPPNQNVGGDVSPRPPYNRRPWPRRCRHHHHHHHIIIGLRYIEITQQTCIKHIQLLAEMSATKSKDTS